eukprot:CAMPEP_0177188336 /NCGR_PEP_ID=MMETSP0367-20130122/19675_1 /TAXON_ID=447022 ORGANISM="Scrippsiella hangoei-like, Strain SHHI-4" /NCGR_SAMPLE_ID=MMETSP0367 /ASSEMBLY_ACC=CAM_ASM_000362 /LENGTH=359 /DNA_ID=CAMNT_0018635789 /DNA_START=50 /DNA_END=1129 /DNA_ORIENTATION=+
MGNKVGGCLDGLTGSGAKGPVGKPGKKGFKVCVCGGSTKIGKPLCLLLALDPRVAELCIQDLAITMPPPDVLAEDLQHVGIRCKVKPYALEAIQRPVDHLRECLTGCDLVIACAGWPNNGRTHSDILKLNGSVAKNVVEACALYCPDAVVGLIMNPLNSLVPAMAKLYEKAGLDPMKICGITTLDIVRSNKFVHIETGVPIERVSVPVVGGHGGVSALPLFSQDPTAAKLTAATQEALVRHVQEGGAEVMKEMLGKCGATLSQAYACSRFAQAVLNGLGGTKTEECCFVKSSKCEGLEFFASKVTFGTNGIEQVHPIGPLSKKEQELLVEVKKSLAVDIEAGLKYAEGVELAKGGGDAR